jgi:hypothetical protein
LDFTAPFFALVVFVVLSYPSRLLFEVVEFEVEVVALPLLLDDLYVLMDVPFMVVSFLLDSVTEDTTCATEPICASSTEESTTFFHSLPPIPSPIPPRKNLELHH